MLPSIVSSLTASAVLLAAGLAGVAAVPTGNEYVNTAIARTVELGGATTLVTTQYNVKALVDSPGEYWLALSGKDEDAPAWWEVSVGGKVVEGLQLVKASPKSAGRAQTVAVPLGTIKKDGTATLSLSHSLIHTSSPLPATIEQRDPQFLLWKTNSTYVDSWYATDVERIKIRSPSPNIVSYSSVPSTYTRDNTVTKSASTLTLGPFHSLPATLGDKSSAVQQSAFQVHYETKDPVIGLRSLRRWAEVSHWGGNLNIQDEMDLVNMGPKLKGHFSRLAHQQSRFHAGTPAQVLTELTLRLPPTAHTAYYYDTIGNVSTSHFRAGSTPALQAKSKVRTSPRLVDAQLELKPRYPLLGGWNYSFTVGWDMPLGDALKVQQDGRHVLAVPFLTAVRDLLVDDVELTIVLPEGATDVEVHAPFGLDSVAHSIHKTYMDTTGRYALTIRKARCTEQHAQLIYVTYTYPTVALLQKPLAVSAVAGGLFVLAMGLRRMEWSIEKRA